ncbi:MAG: haloalkane dehalogenase [Candidatus Sumerlaeota bacterium]|nr:haloalkane dehalogenase [Candidatus Sumerlaeota bacterium]
MIPPSGQPEADAFWMDRALGQARLAAGRGEVPIGCVIVRGGELLASAHDGKELFWEPTAHAEILAIRQAAARAGDWRLDGATLYVTLEPCPMCAGAMLHARIARLVYGASNPRWGACSGACNLLADTRFNHRVEIHAGVREEACAALLRETFRQWRRAKRG